MTLMRRLSELSDAEREQAWATGETLLAPHPLTKTETTVRIVNVELVVTAAARVVRFEYTPVNDAGDLQLFDPKRSQPPVPAAPRRTTGSRLCPNCGLPAPADGTCCCD